MRPGDVVAERFELLCLAGAGGMGSVYRARDRRSGGLVGLKVLHGAVGRGRFEREARVLSELDHPGVVHYVAHGVGSDGAPYLAMEWLDGEDLERRLARGRPTIDEAVALCRTIGEALGVAHARGIVHRDLKPSNLFLVGGELTRVKVLDFGIAIAGHGATRQTRTGAAMGTPGYMAPEQARGAPEVDARADVFSLGCVLFECLTGRAAFAGAHVMAILAKILLEDPPRASELSPEVPSTLDVLVARMLSKDARARPSDGAAVASALSALTAPAPRALSISPPGPASLSGAEQRHIAVLALSDPRGATAATVRVDDTAEGLDPILAIIRAFDARVELLLDGSVIATLPGSGTATDQAARAAALALALREAVPDAAMALATGRAEVGRKVPVGEAIDRVAALLRRRADPATAIRIDEVTAELLDERFALAREDGPLLVGRRESDSVRTLLGKPTACVGREIELAALDALVEQAVSEPSARAVVVTGPAGVGKSRLRHELLRRVRARPEPIVVLTARGDAIGAGSAFSLAAQALRRAAGVIEGAALELRRSRIAAHVARHVPAEQVDRVTHFLGEMTGVPFPDEGDVPLRAARTNPILMGDQIRRAWEDFIDAETRAHPVVIVLEDLHWGDLPTITLVDAALRLFPDRPLLVAAFARPEVEDLFPALWSDHEPHRVALAGLTRRASERLVRAVLAGGITEDRVAQIVERAAGNAFYLEELIRSVAEGHGDALPETVLAMTEARIMGLAPETRRVLRAASVFGTTFWEQGVVALVSDEAAEVAASRLAELDRRELIARGATTRIAGTTSYTFRHATVRDAAYGMLTEADRALGHRLAAAWLEAAGEGNPMVLAEHFDKGGEPERAAQAFLRAAEEALEGNDFKAAIDRAERGVRLGTQGELLGDLRWVEAEAHYWRGETVERGRAAAEAMTLLRRGSDRWGDAAGHLGAAIVSSGDVTQIAAVAEDLRDVVERGSVTSGCLRAAARVVVQCLNVGRQDLAAPLLAAVERAVQRSTAGPGVRARLAITRGVRALHQGDPGAHLDFAARAAAEYTEAGDAREACNMHVSMGYGLLELGAFAEAEAVLRGALAVAERLRLEHAVLHAKNNLGWAVARQGRLEEAATLERECLDACGVQNRRMAGGSRSYLAAILLDAGDLPGAEAEAGAALALLGDIPKMRPFALAILARVLGRAGRLSEALEAARQAQAMLDAGGVDEGEGLIHLVYAEALIELGDEGGAALAVAAARQSLMARASKIADELRRRIFLEDVPEHARTLELAAAWLGSPG